MNTQTKTFFQEIYGQDFRFVPSFFTLFTNLKQQSSHVSSQDANCVIDLGKDDYQVLSSDE